MVGLGSIRLPINRFQYFTVTGGPYMARPQNMKGVKMAPEINTPCSVYVPTRDYSVPTVKVLNGGLSAAVDLILDGQSLYVGCFGGKGRTGLFLSVLAKAFGIQNPVEFIRKNYYSHAVETSEQYKFVQDFEIPKSVIEAIKRKRRWCWINFMKTNLTKMPVEVVEEPKKEDELSETLHEMYDEK